MAPLLYLSSSRMLKKENSCFDKLSTNGKYSIISSSSPFALRFSKGERWVFQQPASSLAGTGVVFDAPLHEGDGLGNRESEHENNGYESPEFLHQKVLRIQFEQLAYPNNCY